MEVLPVLQSAMIVDDEPFMRNALRKLVDWESIGITFVSEAHNGSEALKRLRSHPVDLILTDIKMPVMDGLELIVEVKQAYPRTRVIVLSAYDEFHLVKEALKLGVEDYLLKAELTGDSLRQVISAADRSVSDLGRVKQLYEENLEAVRSSTLRDLLFRGRSPGAEDVTRLGDLGIPIADTAYCVIVFGFDAVTPSEGGLPDGEAAELTPSQMSHIVSGALDEYGSGDGCLYWFPLDRRSCFILNCVPVAEGWNQTTTYLDGLQGKISDIAGDLPARVSGGVSSRSLTLADLTEMHRQAAEALAFSFVRGKGRLLYASSIRHRPAAVAIEDQRLISLLKELLRSHDAQRILQEKASLAVGAGLLGPENIPTVLRLFDQYCFLIEDYLDHYPVSTRSEVREEVDLYRSTVRRSGDLRDFNSWLDRVLRKVAGGVGSRSLLVTRALAVVEETAQSGLSLATLAARLGVSESYLSRVFSKEVGMSLTAYREKLRVNRAIEYMREGQMKIYEVAEKVGYTSAEHFSRVFKKIVGKSPKQYFGTQHKSGAS